MDSESIAHEAEGAIDLEAMRARGIIVLHKLKQIRNNIKYYAVLPSEYY